MSERKITPEEIEHLNRYGEELDRMFPDARHRYYGRDGKPIGFGDWAAITENGDRIVCSSYLWRDGSRLDVKNMNELKALPAERVAGATHVSTVHLGLDHNFSGEGPPLIFETMVFEAPTEDLDHFTERYATEAAAIAGHERVVERVRAAFR